MVIIQWRTVPYFSLITLFLEVPIILTIINTFSAFFFGSHIDRINPWTSGVALTILCSSVLGSSLPLSSSISNSLCASQLSSLTFGLSNSPFQLTQISVSEMLSGELSTAPWSGWRSICLNWWTFNTWGRPPGMFFADKAGCKGDFSDNSNEAAPYWWKFDQDGLTICLVSEIYVMAVISLFWVRDSICVAHRIWLPYHISKNSLTLAVRCNFVCSAFLFLSMLFSVLVLSNAGLLLARNPLLARVNILTTAFLQRVSPGVCDCLHPITSCPGEELASSPTP